MPKPILAALLWLAAAFPAVAQACPPERPMTAAETAGTQQAIERGLLLYAYDQAAWHATDALQAAAADRGGMAWLGQHTAGWIVRGPLTAPEVVFYDNDTANPHAFWVARMSSGGAAVVSSRFVDAGTEPLDAAARGMIAARQHVVAYAGGHPLLRCGPAFNTVVLPPSAAGEPTLVYLLSPQTDMAHVPFGGHHRFAVTGDGRMSEPHAFTRSCLSLPTPRAPERPVLAYATQLNDPLPTEVDVFTMMAAAMPIMVGTVPDGRTWAIEPADGRPRIRLVDRPPDALPAGRS